MSSLRSVRVNSTLLKQLRAQSGLTQAELAKRAGYTERLIRKAEGGGSLSHETIETLAETLRQLGLSVTARQLCIDQLTIARKWIEDFEQHEARMIPFVRDFLSEELVFVCPGKEATAPFIGKWKGIAGLQGFLDAYFAVFRRVPMTDVTYTVGTDTVSVRFLESGYIGDHLCGPIRVNMHFQFDSDGLIVRIDDEYDTQAGADTKAIADEKLNER